ncbi:protein adenylyltransferase SelO family protein [Lentisphaera marina]|uniref:protein adenylyltransferase SelO n=1 Tax=Lentisphaera marina TaxID=1111041 RepID=UPI0023661E33|nr:protein adenylyltransferase SelO family protein [Lentisphaera marina]MDD7983965.1 protein adenylyltransferase SelO family protein [Lentisphaera marina]
MPNPSQPSTDNYINSFDEFARLADYSLMDKLNADPKASSDGIDHHSREVFSGHFVPVKPTPIPDPEYISHSPSLFQELALSDELAHDADFIKLFSGDSSSTPEAMRPYGWATGYALSIYGNEYTHQCPFRTGNGYGDGRAISIIEVVTKGKRWEMQLKGGGPTPYCRGGDGRAVLRSSVREFLAQEFMHALGIPTSRSLTLYVSKSETVSRPWYSGDSNSLNPDTYVDNPAAISTRVAPSFLRVGQIELFARRARSNAHPQALEELRMIVEHLIEREYLDEIDKNLPFTDQVIELAKLFKSRLTRLIADWIRVGFCQGNFNSDNCPAGGYTLDYGPFGFSEVFDPEFQPWTGGGNHFEFFNQPVAAETNFHMFWTAIRLLLADDQQALEKLDQVRHHFASEMKVQVEQMWAQKLGLSEFNLELFQELMQLMTESKVDYTIFFRELSHIPDNISTLKKSFYEVSSAEVDAKWQNWLDKWRELLSRSGDLSEISKEMLETNPKYTWREWLIVPAYEQAMQGDYTLVKELQNVLNDPYEEQSKEIEDKYYRLRPKEFFHAGGVSHYSCSS